jgi:hypothetical protein
MPNARDLAKLSLVINSVHNSIRPKDDLANEIIPILGNDVSQTLEILAEGSVAEIRSSPKDIAWLGLSHARR